MSSKRKSEDNLPEIYMCCGKEDFLYHLSYAYVEHLRSLDIPFVYEEDAGYCHDMGYCDLKIQRAIEWMGL